MLSKQVFVVVFNDWQPVQVVGVWQVKPNGPPDAQTPLQQDGRPDPQVLPKLAHPGPGVGVLVGVGPELNGVGVLVGVGPELNGVGVRVGVGGAEAHQLGVLHAAMHADDEQLAKSHHCELPV